jgi:hypothetical protein
VHRIWHAGVLGITLVALAGVLLLLLAPLLPDPPRLTRARPLVLGLAGVAAALLVVEWLVIHDRSL